MNVDLKRLENRIDSLCNGDPTAMDYDIQRILQEMLATIIVLKEEIDKLNDPHRRYE